ncbi:MAG: c-type cytochrome [Betaproteobacteria bacterium]|nr:c-type cytochrome [Betaproteobacteria bacterium]
MSDTDTDRGRGSREIARRAARAPRHFVAILLCCLGPVAGVALAAGDGASGNPPRAEQLYRKHCAVCHGERGDGRTPARANLVPPPRDFTSAAARALSRARMIAAARDGKPGTAMVGWKTRLKASEVEALVDYIRDSFVQPQTSAAFSRGRAVYMQMCVACHGAHGQGVVWAAGNVLKPPRAFGSPEARRELTRERMISIVAQGKPGSAMGPYAGQLTKSDIEGAVDFIRAAFMEPAASADRQNIGRPAPEAAGDPAAPMPKGLAGNSERGGRFYAANCTTCHGVNGDGQGPRARLISPKPRSLSDAVSRARLSRPALFAAIAAGKPGTDMPAWDKVLTDQEIADVAEYVFLGFVNPKANPRISETRK